MTSFSPQEALIADEDLVDISNFGCGCGCCSSPEADAVAWAPSDLSFSGDATSTSAESSEEILPTYTTEQFALQLTSNYWRRIGQIGHRRFELDETRILTFDITQLEEVGSHYARSALELLSEYIGIQFEEVTENAQINFTNFGNNAYGSTQQNSDGIVSSGIVNVGTGRLPDKIPEVMVGSQTWFTYVHEIFHGLGLGHAGHYNGPDTKTEGRLAINDSFAMSAQSYFLPKFTGVEPANFKFAAGPMRAEIEAFAMLYGENKNAFLTDDTYGFNSSFDGILAEALSFDNRSGTGGFTIHDRGGLDILDGSGYSGAQTLDLRPGEGSSLKGFRFNVWITEGSIIENAIGGNGDEIVFGNEANNVLDGGGGSDTVYWQASIDEFVVYFNQANDEFTVAHANPSSDYEGADLVKNFETFKFAGVAFTKQEMIDLASQPQVVNLNALQ